MQFGLRPFSCSGKKRAKRSRYRGNCVSRSRAPNPSPLYTPRRTYDAAEHLNVVTATALQQRNCYRRCDGGWLSNGFYGLPYIHDFTYIFLFVRSWKALPAMRRGIVKGAHLPVAPLYSASFGTFLAETRKVRKTRLTAKFQFIEFHTPGRCKPVRGRACCRARQKRTHRSVRPLSFIPCRRRRR